MPYEKVCKAFDALDSIGLTSRPAIREVPLEAIVNALRGAGFRFPNQTGSFIKKFGDNPIDLNVATRDEIARSIPGIGMKLASMFLRNTRKENHAVIDVHIKRYLGERGLLTKSYLQNEINLKNIAQQMGISVAELDFNIWEERRIGNRKKKDN